MGQAASERLPDACTVEPEKDTPSPEKDISVSTESTQLGDVEDGYFSCASDDDEPEKAPCTEAETQVSPGLERYLSRCELDKKMEALQQKGRDDKSWIRKPVLTPSPPKKEGQHDAACDAAPATPSPRAKPAVDATPGSDALEEASPSARSPNRWKKSLSIEVDATLSVPRACVPSSDDGSNRSRVSASKRQAVLSPQPTCYFSPGRNRKCDRTAPITMDDLELALLGYSPYTSARSAESAPTGTATKPSASQTPQAEQPHVGTPKASRVIGNFGFKRTPPRPQAVETWPGWETETDASDAPPRRGRTPQASSPGERVIVIL